MRQSFSFVFLFLLFACQKEESSCWECSVMTISNEIGICTDPELIMTLEPTNVQIICSADEKEDYMTTNDLSSERIEKNCPDGLRFYVVSKSPVCTLQP